MLDEYLLIIGLLSRHPHIAIKYLITANLISLILKITYS